jgi:hypothetical protein
MRLVTTVTIAALALLATAGSAAATHSTGKGPGKDLVAGTGAIDTPVTPFGPVFVKLHVNAKSGPFGTDPRGRVAFRGNPPPIGEIDIKGRVTCVNVFGNQAIVGFEITKAKAGPIPEGAGGIFSILDNGEPGTADAFEGGPLPQPPTICPLFPATRTITQGNFIVHDATG